MASYSIYCLVAGFCATSGLMEFIYVVAYGSSMFFFHCGLVFQHGNISVLFLLVFGLLPVCRSYKQCCCEHPVGPLCTYAVTGVGSASQEWSRWVIGWACVSLIRNCKTVVQSGCTSSIPISTESPSCSMSSLILDTILLLFMNLFQPVW